MGRCSDVEALLSAAQRGDASALEALLERVHTDLGGAFSRLARAWRASEKEAGDLLDEVALAVLRGLAGLRSVRYTVFLAWCTETARNHLRTEYRTQRRRARRHEQKAALVAEAAVLGRAPVPDVEVSADLGTLPASQRSAFVLREGLELAWDTIGFVLSGRPADAARQLHGRARARLSRTVRA